MELLVGRWISRARKGAVGYSDPAGLVGGRDAESLTVGGCGCASTDRDKRCESDPVGLFAGPGHLASNSVKAEAEEALADLARGDLEEGFALLGGQGGGADGRRGVSGCGTGGCDAGV